MPPMPPIFQTKFSLMLKVRLFLLLHLFVLLNACVQPKIYKAEVETRRAAEARESVLVKELLDRKKETGELVKQVGELNRTIGNQEEEIKDLNAELSTRTQKMGESSSKLATEKMALEKELSTANAELEKRNALLLKVQNAQEERKKILEELKASLAKRYAEQTEVTLTNEGEAVFLTLPDKLLFDSKGLEISTSGKALLKPLTEILTSRPELDVDLVCYTDNVLPRDKSLSDTWDWSLRRATNITRSLIADFNVNANQLTPVGRGEYYPLTSNATPEGRQKNRRTVLVMRPVLPAIPAAE